MRVTVTRAVTYSPASAAAWRLIALKVKGRRTDQGAPRVRTHALVTRTRYQ